MSECGDKKADCRSGTRACGGGRRDTSCAGETPASEAVAHFDGMIDHCLDYAESARKAGRPIVGILCEYAPREVILAAGGVPVCLCGGSAEMVAPAEEQLPANLCPIIKSTFGYHLTRSNPFLEMADLVVAETTCDGKKKMYELMAESRPMYVLELPQKPDDADAFSHWTAEIRKLAAFLGRRYGTEITPAKLNEAIVAMNRYRGLRRRLAEFMRPAAPHLTGRQLLDMKSIIWGMGGDVAAYEQAIAAFSACAGRSDLAGRVRVLLTGVPVPHGAERVVDLIEGSGGLVTCMENCSGLKPLLEDVEEGTADPLEAIARKYIQMPCSVMTRNDARLESLGRLCQEYRPQCVIELVWQACLTYDVESARVKRFVEGKLALPYLRISTDYSPGDSSRLALRIEALFEMVRARGASTNAQ